MIDKEEAQQSLFPYEDNKRSVSTDRESRHTDTPQPMPRFPFPARVPAQKSVDTTNNMLDVLCSLQKLNLKKDCLERDDDPFKQALNVRQGGIRKSKTESKVSTKHQLPAKIQMLDATAKVQSSNEEYGTRYGLAHIFLLNI